MKTKLNAVEKYDIATLELNNTLKEFLNTTEHSGAEISKAIKLSTPLLSEIKGYLNKKNKKKFSAEKIRDILADLYKANFIK